MGVKSRRTKALAGVVALAAGFAGVMLQSSVALAELCGGGRESNGCEAGASAAGTGDHDKGDFSPPSS
jgi:hypothetical protein